MDIGVLKSSSAVDGEGHTTCCDDEVLGAGSAIVGTEVPWSRVSTAFMYNSANVELTPELSPTRQPPAGWSPGSATIG